MLGLLYAPMIVWRAVSALTLLAALAPVGLEGCNSRRREPPPGAAPSAEKAPLSKAKPVFAKRTRDGSPVEQFIQQELEKSDSRGERLIVYVGASWCEPCQHFHHALEGGELDSALAGTRFLEFDADRDGNELRAAGYASKYIPLFAVPDPDGRASGRRIEGSVKGERAIREDLMPRLLAMLDGKQTR